MTSITLNDLSSYVRFAQIITITDGSIFGTQIAYDNRIFLCIDGNGYITIDGSNYKLSSGCLIMWRSGLEYTYFSDAKHPLKLVGMNFDFTKTSDKLSSPITPAKAADYNKKLLTENVEFSDIKRFNTPLLLEEMLYLKNTFMELQKEYICKKQYYSYRCNTLCNDILFQLARHSKFSSGTHSKQNSQANKIIEYIQENFNKDISNDYLSEVFNYHPSYIGKIILKATGVPTHQYLINCRVSNAINLLQNGEANVSQTAFMCGFSSIAHFSKCIKEKTGYPPSYYITNI